MQLQAIKNNQHMYHPLTHLKKLEKRDREREESLSRGLAKSTMVPPVVRQQRNTSEEAA